MGRGRRGHVRVTQTCGRWDRCSEPQLRPEPGDVPWAMVGHVPAASAAVSAGERQADTAATAARSRGNRAVAGGGASISFVKATLSFLKALIVFMLRG